MTGHTITLAQIGIDTPSYREQQVRTNDMDEKALHDGLRCGNSAAFQQLVDQHQYKVINTCYGFVHNKEDAEDIAQEVFLEVYSSIATFRQESKLSTWIYRICVTKSLDFLRKQKRKKRAGFLRSMFSRDKEVEQVPSSPSTNPHANIERREREQILRQAVDALSENQKIAITLSQYEGFSYQEIADIMDTTVSAVESLIHRAKENLRKKLYHYYEKQF